MQTRTDGFPTKSRASISGGGGGGGGGRSMVNPSCDKIELNLRFEQAFVLEMENILRLSAVGHHNRNSITYYLSKSITTVSGWLSGLRRIAFNTLLLWWYEVRFPG